MEFEAAMPLDDNDKNWIREEIRTQLEGMETRILTAFHKWASPNEARQRSHSATLRALDLEVESLTDRVKKLEQPGS